MDPEVHAALIREAGPEADAAIGSDEVAEAWSDEALHRMAERIAGIAEPFAHLRLVDWVVAVADGDDLMRLLLRDSGARHGVGLGSDKRRM